MGNLEAVEVACHDDCAGVSVGCAKDAQADAKANATAVERCGWAIVSRRTPIASFLEVAAVAGAEAHSHQFNDP